MGLPSAAAVLLSDPTAAAAHQHTSTPMCHPVTADVLEYGVPILSDNLRSPLIPAVPLREWDT